MIRGTNRLHDLRLYREDPRQRSLGSGSHADEANDCGIVLEALARSTATITVSVLETGQKKGGLL